MKVVCFGDSNTYGYDPRSWLGGRYPAESRWVDLLGPKDRLGGCQSGGKWPVYSTAADAFAGGCRSCNCHAGHQRSAAGLHAGKDHGPDEAFSAKPVTATRACPANCPAAHGAGGNGSPTHR